MSAFAKQAATQRALAPEKRPAPKVVRVPAEAFADTWSGRPKPGETRAMGLRIISAADVQAVREAASKTAWSHHPREADVDARIEHYNDALMREVLAIALCKPEDASLPYWDKVASTAVFVALTEAGVRLLWQAYEELKVSADPTGEQATEDDVKALLDAFEDGRVDGLGPVKAARMKRLVSAAVMVLSEV